MPKKFRKQLMFDLDTSVAEQILGETKYRRIYEEMRSFLETNGFEHIQGSGYISTEPVATSELLHILQEMIEWRCVNLISLIKKIIYLIESEKNWKARTSDAPRVIKVSKNVFRLGGLK